MTVSYVWHEVWPVPAGAVVRQVYAWILDERGRVLLIEMPSAWNLPGGTPEVGEGWEATLRREVLEEADVTIRDLVPLGFQEVRSPNRDPYVQVRVAARVDEWRRPSPDPDTGLVYPRVWVPLGEAAERLGWGAPGRAQAAVAARVAVAVYGFGAVRDVAQGASVSRTPVTQVV